MKSRSIPTCSKVPALVLYLRNKAYLDLFTQIVDQNVNLTVLLVATTRVVEANFRGEFALCVSNAPNVLLQRHLAS